MNKTKNEQAEQLFLQIMEIEVAMELGRMLGKVSDSEYVEAVTLQASLKSELDILARELGILK